MSRRVKNCDRQILTWSQVGDAVAHDVELWDDAGGSPIQNWDARYLLHLLNEGKLFHTKVQRYWRRVRDWEDFGRCARSKIEMRNKVADRYDTISGYTVSEIELAMENETLEAEFDEGDQDFERWSKSSLGA